MRVDITKEWTLDRAKIEGAKEFAEKLTSRLEKFVWKHNIPKCMYDDVMKQLLEEYTK